MFLVTAYLDLLPFALFDPSALPTPDYTVYFWIRFLSLSFASVVVPLIMPREHFRINSKVGIIHISTSNSNSLCMLIIHRTWSPLAPSKLPRQYRS